MTWCHFWTLAWHAPDCFNFFTFQPNYFEISFLLSLSQRVPKSFLEHRICRMLIDVRWKICDPWVEKTRGQRKLNSLSTVWVLFFAFFFPHWSPTQCSCTNEDYNSLRGDQKRASQSCLTMGPIWSLKTLQAEYSVELIHSFSPPGHMV